MRRICIQSGHWGMTSGATGAPREQERTIAIGLRLTQLLAAIGVETYRDDAFDDNDPKVNDTDWDLYLALHCDANYAGDEGGGFVDWIDPSIDSSVESNKESQRIAGAIEQVYFSESGIRNVPGRRNPNTKFYYMWNVLSANTHCVIIEMGESIDPHDNVILNDIERVSQILLRGIQNAFPDLKPTTTPTTPPSTDACATFKTEITRLNDIIGKVKDPQIEQLKKDVIAAQATSSSCLAEKNSLSVQLQECQRQAQTYKAEYDKAIGPTGYIEVIKQADIDKGLLRTEITNLNTKLTKITNQYNNLKKPGLKFIQAAVIAMCEKLGVQL